jgi:hemerythrin
MPYMQWLDEYSVGVSVFDDEHKKLIAMLNALHESMVAGQSKQKLFEILDGMIDYTVKHFAHEEELFRRTGYPESITHKLRHEDLKAKVISLRQRAEQKVSGALVIELSNFLHDWLINHIQGEDKRYGPYLNAHGIF